MESQFIGIDDWAIRKGHRYGTLICDLERHRPIAVLPDRKSETISAWLKQHANVSLVSRDRGGEYSRGISEGNPNCQQVADRWHLIHNAWQWMTKEVLRCMPELRKTERIQLVTPCSNTEAVDTETVETTNSPRFENHLFDKAVINEADVSHIAKEDSKNLGIAQAQRKESILALAAQSLSIGQISRKLEITRNTVRAYLRGTHRGRAQGTQTDTQRKSLIDPYLTKLEAMAADKTKNAMDIYRAIVELGYCGGIHTVRRTLAKCRKNLEKAELNRPSPQKQFNAYQFCRTLLKNSQECDEHELKLRDTIQEQIPSLERTARTLRDFIEAIRTKAGAALDRWRESFHLASTETEINADDTSTRFFRQIERDWEAVANSVRYKWSNGQLEGQINRLKMIKRQMYGRAKPDLIAARLLAYS